MERTHEEVKKQRKYYTSSCATCFLTKPTHRGQVCMLAHQLGFPLPNRVAAGDLELGKLWKECGSPGGPGYDS